MLPTGSGNAILPIRTKTGKTLLPIQSLNICNAVRKRAFMTADVALTVSSFREMQVCSGLRAGSSAICLYQSKSVRAR